MRARFIGDPRRGGDGPSILPFMGVTFVKGDWSDELPDPVARKVRSNSHFETSENSAIAPAADAQTVDPNAQNSAAIKAELDTLKVEYDGRIKDPVKLAKILEDAKASLAKGPSVDGPEAEHRAELTALLQGLGQTVDPNATVEDLEAALDAATKGDGT